MKPEQAKRTNEVMEPFNPFRDLVWSASPRGDGYVRVKVTNGSFGFWLHITEDADAEQLTTLSERVISAFWVVFQQQAANHVVIDAMARVVAAAKTESP